MLMSVSRHSLQRYNKFQSLRRQNIFSESDELEYIVNKKRNRSTAESQRKNLCCKKASTLGQSKRPDWDSRSIRSGFDVTALTLPGFPMRGREPFETRFQGGTQIRGFNQIEKFLQQITQQNKLYYFSEKRLWG